MYSLLVMFWEEIPMCIYLCLYSGPPSPLSLYFHPNWADIIHHRPLLESLLLFIMQSMIHIKVLLYSPTYMFLPILSIFLLDIVMLCYLDQPYLIPLGKSNDPLLYVKLMLSFSIQEDFLPVPVVYMLDHNLYL